MLDEVFDWLDGLDPVNEPEEARVRIGEEVRRLGFETVTYTAPRPRRPNGLPVLFTTFPEAWIERYIANEYFTHDPVLLASARSFKPFSWCQLYTKRGVSPAEDQVMREAREHGLRYGAAIPVHSPSGSLGVFSVASNSTRSAFEEAWKGAWPTLQAIAMSCHNAVEQALLHSTADAPPTLTDREREILLWTARGKTAWEVSKILAVSRETVNFHMKNIMAKLDAASKHHAVVKGVMHGHIVP